MKPYPRAFLRFLHVVAGVGVGVALSGIVYGYGLVEPVRNTTWYGLLGIILMFVGWVAAAGIEAKHKAAEAKNTQP